MVQTTETAPDLTGTNPFQLIAYILFKVRHSLEDQESDRAPRWIRISRARVAQGESDYIGKGVKVAVNGFAEALSYMAELTLDIKEILVQTDAAKALVEVSLDLVRAATDDNFVNGVRALVGEQPGDNPLGVVGPTLDDINEYLGYIPEPDDLIGLGHELYRLLAVEQLAFPRTNDLRVDENALGPDTSRHLDIDTSGKIRLLQWAYGEGLTTHGLGTRENPESDELELFRFGSRRLWQTAANRLPNSSVGTVSDDGLEETVFEFFFDNREQTANNRTLDLVEANTLLEKLGYTQPAVSDNKVFSNELSQRLKRFQVVNDLPTTGELDNETINLLMNLDFRGKNLRRARPFDPARIPEGLDDPIPVRAGKLKLVNPGADNPEDERITVRQDKPKYAYYIAGTPLPATGPTPVPTGGGWVRDIGSDLIQGFVALKSRELIGDEYDKDHLSEGEAHHGKFFFAARHTEPWKPSRNHRPDNGALFGAPGAGQPQFGAISRMYQWVSLQDVKNPKPADYGIYITASVQRRSLYREREVDQGRMIIEFYGSNVFQGDLGTRRPTGGEAPAYISQHATSWFPSSGEVTSSRGMANSSLKRNWTEQRLADLPVPEAPREAVALLVVLEGRFINTLAWDIDAYFDDVSLTWEYKKE